jgi:hypothetical protein
MKQLILAVATLVTLSGCAFGNRHVTLAYPPQPPAGVRPATATPPSDLAARGNVILIVLLDQRSTKQAIGSVHNGFGMHTADVVATNDVAGWVTNGVKAELEKAGFTVVRVPAAAAGTGDPVISGEIIKVYCEAWTKYEAEVAIDVRVVKEGKEILKKSYVGKNDSTMNWGASAKSYGQALAVALSNAAGNFAAEMRRDFSLLQ